MPDTKPRPLAGSLMTAAVVTAGCLLATQDHAWIALAYGFLGGAIGMGTYWHYMSARILRIKDETIALQRERLASLGRDHG